MATIRHGDFVIIHVSLTTTDDATVESVQVHNEIALRLDYGIRFDFTGIHGKTADYADAIIPTAIKRDDGKPVSVKSAIFRDFNNKGIYHCYVKMVI
jgi:hypothetical protein